MKRKLQGIIVFFLSFCVILISFGFGGCKENGCIGCERHFCICLASVTNIEVIDRQLHFDEVESTLLVNYEFKIYGEGSSIQMTEFRCLSRLWIENGRVIADLQYYEHDWNVIQPLWLLEGEVSIYIRAVARISYNQTIKSPTSKLIYEVTTPWLFRTPQTMITRGEFFDGDIGVVRSPRGNDVDIVYEFEHIQECLLNELTFYPTGRVVGIPARSGRYVVRITATAEGHLCLSFGFSLLIQEPFTLLQNGVFEAEYINLDGMTGSGHNSGVLEADMIIAVDNASNGFLVGNWTSNVFRFVFYSTKEVKKAELEVALASDAGDLRLSDNDYVVEINGYRLSFPNFIVHGQSQPFNARPTIITPRINIIRLGKINIKQGRNKITLQTVGQNLSMTGGHFMATPAIDFIAIRNLADAQLSWRPRIFNLNRFN